MNNCKFLILTMAFGISVSAVSAQTTTHEITLLVDTATLSNQNPSASCQFMAGEGTVVLVDSPPEAFTFEAEVGDTIRWSAVAMGGTGESIQIRKIKYDRGINIFPAREMDGENVVEATITKGNHGDDYKYVVSFKIGNTGAMYRIDPKIQVK
jgi:hypothetical protein